MKVTVWGRARSSVENVMTTTLSISLPARAKAFVEQQAVKAGYATASEYVRAMILDLQRRRAKDDLDTKLLEGLRSPTVRATDELWAELEGIHAHT